MIDDLMDEPDCDEGPGDIDREPEECGWHKCECPFCFCSIQTKDGICDSCLNGAHQG